MKQIKTNSWKIINSILIICLFTYFIKENSNLKKHKTRIAYVDNLKIFNDFNMTKELTKQNEEKYKPQIKTYDSLVNAIKFLETDLQKLKTIPNKRKTEYAKLQKTVVEKDKELKQIQAYVQSEISNKTWKRINEYIKSYGEKFNLDIILGAQGQGNIMYGKDNVNITEEFLKYANRKYEGN